MPVIYKITPVPKPRMTQRDKWAKRACVLRYRSFADKVRDLGIDLLPSGCHVTFEIPMPKSWSKKKKKEMALTPHTNLGDIDNYLKSLLDAIYKDDSHIWNIQITKKWARIESSGCIVISRIKEPI